MHLQAIVTHEPHLYNIANVGFEVVHSNRESKVSHLWTETGRGLNDSSRVKTMTGSDWPPINPGTALDRV